MTRVPSRSHIALLAILLTATPSLAFSQTTVPTREGNIWGGRDHQPQQGQVVQNEKAAGVALSPKQENANAHEVNDLYQWLMRSTSGSAE